MGFGVGNRAEDSYRKFVDIALPERAFAAYERRHVAGAVSAYSQVSARIGENTADAADVAVVGGDIPPGSSRRSALQRRQDQISEVDRTAAG